MTEIGVKLTPPEMCDLIAVCHWTEMAPPPAFTPPAMDVRRSMRMLRNTCVDAEVTLLKGLDLAERRPQDYPTIIDRRYGKGLLPVVGVEFSPTVLDEMNTALRRYAFEELGTNNPEFERHKKLGKLLHLAMNDHRSPRSWPGWKGVYEIDTLRRLKKEPTDVRITAEE